MSLPDEAALLRYAKQQQIAYDERSNRDYQRKVVGEACSMLGADPRRVQHWKSNRNSDLYLVDTAGRRWLLKILTSKPVESLECEHRALTELHALARESGGFRVPVPGPLLEGQSAYLMEWVEGRPLHTALLDRNFVHGSAVEALGRCGAALATIHQAWGLAPLVFTADKLRADLVHLPWTPSVREERILSHALEALDGSSFPRSRLYLDFDPVNVLLAPGCEIALLDPPERVAEDAVHWDLGTFLFGLRRAAWRWPPAYPRLASRLLVLRRAFLAGYTRSASTNDGSGDLFVAVAELFRLAQLWTWWMQPMNFRHRVVGLGRSVYAYPLLRASRYSRLREIGRLTRCLR